MPTNALEAARDLYDLIDREADAAGDDPVPRATVDALVEADLHAVMSPKDVGGGELSLVDAIDVFTEVARADGSAGWCLMANAATISFFGSWAADDFSQQLFAEGVPLAAGQFAPNGTAVADGDGWLVQGDYQFGSGVNHSTWIGGGVMAEPADGGDAKYLFMLMPVDEVEMRGNWDVLGLVSTASWDYAVRDVHVPDGATFEFFAPVRHRGGPVYDLGVLCLTAAGHAGFAAGVGRRVLDELQAVAMTKHRMGAATPLHESERFLHELASLESRFRSAMAWMRDTFVAAERTVADGGAADPAEINATRQSTVFLTQEVADIARQAYLLAGTTALRDGALQRCFRDIHAGSQHFFAGPSATLDFGRDLLAAAAD